MFDSPKVRLAARCILAGVLVAAASLQEQLPFDPADIYPALLKGVIAAGIFLTTAAVTPIDKSVNVEVK